MQRQLSVSQFLTLDFNINKQVNSVIIGKRFQILAPEEVIVLVPDLTESTLFLLRYSAFRKFYVTFLFFHDCWV